jgi:hypothetical protein
MAETFLLIGGLDLLCPWILQEATALYLYYVQLFVCWWEQKLLASEMSFSLQKTQVS